MLEYAEDAGAAEEGFGDCCIEWLVTGLEGRAGQHWIFGFRREEKMRGKTHRNETMSLRDHLEKSSSL